MRMNGPVGQKVKTKNKRQKAKEEITGERNPE